MQRVKWHRKEKKLPLKAASNSSYLNQRFFLLEKNLIHIALFRQAKSIE